MLPVPGMCGEDQRTGGGDIHRKPTDSLCQLGRFLHRQQEIWNHLKASTPTLRVATTKDRGTPAMIASVTNTQSRESLSWSGWSAAGDLWEVCSLPASQCSQQGIFSSPRWRRLPSAPVWASEWVGVEPVPPGRATFHAGLIVPTDKYKYRLGRGYKYRGKVQIYLGINQYCL